MKLHNEEFNNLCSSPNIIRAIKSKKMIWARHVARMESREIHTCLYLEKAEIKRLLGTHRGEGWIILKWILKN
jgi:hypothetical protein